MESEQNINCPTVYLLVLMQCMDTFDEDLQKNMTETPKNALQIQTAQQRMYNIYFKRI